MRVEIRRWSSKSDCPPDSIPHAIAANPATAAAYQLGYTNGVTMGMAQGELKGRNELASELEVQYGIDAREDLDAEAVRRIRVRQVH